MSGLAGLLAGASDAGDLPLARRLRGRDVRHTVEHAGWHFAYFDGWHGETKAEFLERRRRGARLPRRLRPELRRPRRLPRRRGRRRQRGLAAALGRLGPVRPRRRAGVLGGSRVLGGRVNAERGGPFAVLLRGDGPDGPFAAPPPATAPRSRTCRVGCD